jgi:TolB protein
MNELATSCCRSLSRASRVGLCVPALAVCGAMGLLTADAAGTPPGRNGDIAFARYVDESRTAGAIFAITGDGRATRRLTAPPRGAADQHPDWSWNGARLTFERCVRLFTSSEQCAVGVAGRRGADVRIVKPRCGTPGRKELCPLVRGPSFSRQGKIVVGLAWGRRRFQPSGVSCPCVDNQYEHYELALMNADGTDVQMIFGLDGWRGSLNRPQVSPDGRRLVVERRNSWLSRPKGGSALFVINLDGSGMRQVTPWNIAAGDGPDWSPDGRRIVFRAPRLESFAGSNLYTIGADGTDLRQVTHFPKSVEVLSSSYSPDGKWIVFSRSGRGGLPDLFVVRPNGSGLRQLTRTPEWDSAPDWGPGRS